MNNNKDVSQHCHVILGYTHESVIYKTRTAVLSLFSTFLRVSWRTVTMLGHSASEQWTISTVTKKEQ